MRLQFGLDAYTHRSRSIASQRIVNCYLEKQPQNSPNPVALLGAYGVKAFATTTGACRGGRVINGVPYVVAGTKLYKINSNGTATNLGTIPNADKVSIAGDGTNVAVATGGALYAYDGLTVSLVSDADLPGADWVEYIGTYFVVGHEGQVYISNNLDPTDWAALDFVTAEASPDDIVGGIVEKNELFVGGKDSVQVFYVSSEEVPLTAVPSGYAQIGLLAKHGFANVDNSVFFPATDFTVRRMEGYTPIVVSTHAISQAIEDLADKTTLHGFTFAEGGHNFYGLGSDSWTFVYDTATQLWHQRQSYGLAYWRVFQALYAYNRVLVLDQTQGRVGYLDPNTYQDWSEALVMTGTAQAVHQDYRRIFAPDLELVFDRGVGLTTGQGSDPKVMMRQSFDGGKTWTSERWRTMGKIGEYTARALWTRMGEARDRVIEFSISDPVRRALSYANLIDPELGEH